MTVSSNFINGPLPYNADINLIASVPELRMIYNALGGNVDPAAFDLRTDRTANRLTRVIRVNLLQYYSEDHKALMASAFSNEGAMQSWNLFLFWQLALTNQSVLEILKDVFFPQYFSGRATLPKSEIIAYLDDRKLISDDTQKIWSDSTIERMASKLLTFLKRLEILEGTQVKRFKAIVPDYRELAFFCYLLKAVFPDQPNVLSIPFRIFSFSSQAVFIEQVKRLAVKDLIDMQYDGVQLKIFPKHDYKNLIDVLYHGS